MRERRETRFGRESTRWNRCLSSTLERQLSSFESSHSEESSSSIALSDTTSSSSSLNTSSSSVRSLIVRVATSSLKEVCFLPCIGRLSPSESELCLEYGCMCSSSELSSSPDEPPSINILFFFFFCRSTR